MTGQVLMCVWQAISAADPTHRGVAPASRLRQLSIQFAQKNPDFRYTESSFQSAFPGSNISFEDYREYVREKLVSKLMPQQDAEQIIEEYCWEQANPSYSSLFSENPQLSTEQYFSLWQMFNRICIPGSCPPTVEVNDMNWWANKLALPMGIRWASLPNDAAPLTYARAIELLNAAIFSQNSSKEGIQSIEQLHLWIVREVSMTGWMYKRTRKQPNNWTTWVRRFFVLTPGNIRYYTSALQREKDFKGKVGLGNFSRLETLNSYKSLLRTYANRFRVNNQPIVEMEMSAVFDHEKEAWMAAITEVIDACVKGTTPVQAVLADRLAQHSRRESRQTIDQAVSRLKSKRLSRIPVTLNLEEAQDIPVRPPVCPVYATPVKRDTMASPNDTDSEVEASEDEEMFDNNTYSFEKGKVQEVFNQIDSDKNGSLSEREFDEFMRILVGRATDSEGSFLYLPIFEELVGDGDRIIEFDTFYSYFTRLALNQNPATEAEIALRQEFLGADGDGLGAVDFKDLTEFVWDRRRSYRYRNLLSTLEGSPANGTSWCPILTSFIKIQYGGDSGFNSDFLNADTLGQQIQAGQEEKQIAEVAEQLAVKWESFTTSKNLRSTEPERIAARYNLVDVACFFTSQGQQPPLLSIDAPQWQSYEDNVQLVLPAGSSLEVPLVNATDDLLQYYGCRLADNFQDRVALFYENRIEDMGYANQGFKKVSGRMAVGQGMAKSTISRFYSPLGSNSGHLVIAKWEGDEETLEVTAFTVAINRSVYIPADTMYSMDYTDGTWRSMTHPSPFSTEDAQLKRQFTDGNEADLENVSFTFQ